MDSKNLQHHFYETSNGKKILTCIQCGTCSASCPLTDLMDHAPRELFALIRDGEIEEALRSDTLWYCLSCYQCMVRCPQQIPVTDLMYVLKQMAILHKLAPSHKTIDLYQAFAQEAECHGRISETTLMFRYGFLHPIDMLHQISVGLKLMIKKRLKFFPHKKESANIAPS